MSRFDLIIFDCDGVLVDSERIANLVFAKVLNEELGLTYSLQDMFDTFVGHSTAQCMQIIEQTLGKPPPYNLAERYKTEINKALAESVTAVRGIENTLKNMTTPYCVASSGSYEKMDMTLGRTELRTFFQDKLFSTSDVKRGKPFPDIYIHAANAMGIRNYSRCLVIEDSLPGIIGGVAANMTVFGYCEMMDRQKQIQAGAHLTFNNMSNLLSEIENYHEAG